MVVKLAARFGIVPSSTGAGAGAGAGGEEAAFPNLVAELVSGVVGYDFIFFWFLNWWLSFKLDFIFPDFH